MWSGRYWQAQGKGKRFSMREGCHQDISIEQTNTLSTCITSHWTKKVATCSPKNCRFLLSYPLPTASQAPLQVYQLMCNKLFESLQVLSVELHIIVSSSLHPEWLHRALTAFIQCQTMGEVNDLVFRTMDHKNRWCYVWNLVNALE